MTKVAKVTKVTLAVVDKKAQVPSKENLEIIAGLEDEMKNKEAGDMNRVLLRGLMPVATKRTVLATRDHNKEPAEGDTLAGTPAYATKGANRAVLAHHGYGFVPTKKRGGTIVPRH